MKISTSQQRIQQLMEQYNLTLTEMSKRTGLAKSTLSYYVNGKSIPRQEQIGIIADTFHIDPAWLLGYNVEMRKKAEIDEQIEELTPKEQGLVLDYRELDPYTKEMVDRLIAYAKVTQKGGAVNEHNETEVRKLPDQGTEERTELFADGSDKTISKGGSFSS